MNPSSFRWDSFVLTGFPPLITRDKPGGAGSTTLYLVQAPGPPGNNIYDITKIKPWRVRLSVFFLLFL